MPHYIGAVKRKFIVVLGRVAKTYQDLQSVGKVLARSMFFLTGCIGDRLPLPTPKTMLSFIHLTLRLRGDCKIKYKVLKSKDSVMECYSIQRAKYFCH